MDYSNAVEILPLYAVQQGNRIVALGILVLESYEMFELSTDEVIELLNEGVIHSGYIYMMKIQKYQILSYLQSFIDMKKLEI